MDIGFQISRDGGEYWEHPSRGMVSRGHAWTVAVDPGKEGRLFLSIGQRWSKKGGLFRSDDKGRNWQRIGLGDASMGAIPSISIDLKSPVNKRIIYIATEKKGIYKSSDGGDSWKNISPNFTDNANAATCVMLDPKSAKLLYAGTGGGLFKSNDAGASWVLLGKGVFEKVENISICKNDPSRIYITAHLPGDNGYWGETRLWRSDDAGNHFKNITPGYMEFPGAVAVNPNNPDYLYACANLMQPQKTDQKVLIIRSSDGGSTWQDIGNGIAFSRGKHISIDAQDPKHIFVHTRFAIIEGRDEEAP